MKDFILNALAEVQNGYSLCGVVDRRARVYPPGSDTKVLSALFEIVAHQAVVTYAESVGLRFIEPTQQNHYPDFTLMRDEEDREKIALDVQTTYRKEGQSRFGYTLGSYTSYIRYATVGKEYRLPIQSIWPNIELSGLFTRERKENGTRVTTSIHSTL